MKKIGIIGLGLMGSSLAKALKIERPNVKIVGLDNDSKNLEEAFSRGCLDEVSNSLDMFQECEIIVLAVPVEVILEYINLFSGIDPSQTIIDLGSTKKIISESIPFDIRANFVTVHPMVGTEMSGAKNLVIDLYRDAKVVFCDIEKSADENLKAAVGLFELIGSEIVYMSSEEHDEHAAYVSHSPHIISFALANSVMSHENNKDIVNMAGGGFQDMCRIAKSSPKMWADITKQNKGDILKALESFRYELGICQEMIEKEDWDALEDRFVKANSLHDILK